MGTSYDRLLKTLWENHDPTQGMRQGNDVGTQYRSAIFSFNDAQRSAADASKAVFQKALSAKKLGRITTEIAPSGPFYFAEDDHQQYLAKISGGLLRAWRHRRVVPDRGRPQRLIFAVAASLSRLRERDAFPGDKNAFLTINAARLEHLF